MIIHFYLLGHDNDEFLSPAWHIRKYKDDIINIGGLEGAKFAIQRNFIPLNSYPEVDGAINFTYVSPKGAGVIDCISPSEFLKAGDSMGSVHLPLFFSRDLSQT